MTAEIVPASSSSPLLAKIARDALQESPKANPLAAETLPFPEGAPIVKPSDAQAFAFASLADLREPVQITERRAMTPDEQKQLMEEDQNLRAGEGYIKKRREAVGTMVRHHADCLAEQAGRVVSRPSTSQAGEVIVPASERTAGGNYQLAAPQKPYRIEVPGTGRAWSLEYSAGKTEVHPERLLRLMEEGKISRDEFLAMTRQVRVPSDTKIIEFMRANPERGTEIMGMISDCGASSASLFLRNGSQS